MQEVIQTEFKKYPSIEGFKHKDIKRSKNTTFYGQPKLHGTNAGIQLYEGRYLVHGRNRELTLDSDNYNFAEFALSEPVQEFVQPRLQAVLNSFLESSFFHDFSKEHPGTVKGIALYGEYAGQGIQKNVAISQVEKFFAPFDIAVIYELNDCITDDKITRLWLNSELLEGFRNEDLRIFPVPELWVIDIKSPEDIEEIQSLTIQVENECPFAKIEFGISGIGEGIVWKTSDMYQRSTFKTKGDKHSGKSSRDKVTKTPKQIAKMTKAQLFVEDKVSTRRLQQGLEYLQEFNILLEKKSTKQFIDFVLNDIFKEHSDEISELELDVDTIKKLVPKLAGYHFNKFLTEGEF